MKRNDSVPGKWCDDIASKIKCFLAIIPLYYTRIQYIKVVRDHTTYEKTEATVFSIVLLLYN